jgi:hypothetical protein
MTIFALNLDRETDTTRHRLGGAGLARRLRRTGWDANFMSHDSTKFGVLSREIYSW